MKKLGFYARLRYWFSPTYRWEIEQEERKEHTNALYSKGKELWEEIERKLPKAYGTREKENAPRVEAFRKLKQTFSKEEKEALRLFLNYAISEVNDNFYYITSGEEEKYERNRLQIFQKHLSILEESE